MSKQMILYVATNNTGSECSTELDITETEWNALTEDEQRKLINEYMYDVCSWWVEAED